MGLAFCVLQIRDSELRTAVFGHSAPVLYMSAFHLLPVCRPSQNRPVHKSCKWLHHQRINGLDTHGHGVQRFGHLHC